MALVFLTCMAASSSNAVEDKKDAVIALEDKAESNLNAVVETQTKADGRKKKRAGDVVVEVTSEGAAENEGLPAPKKKGRTEPKANPKPEPKADPKGEEVASPGKGKNDVMRELLILHAQYQKIHGGAQTLLINIEKQEACDWANDDKQLKALFGSFSLP